jgi:hypothetical protein
MQGHRGLGATRSSRRCRDDVDWNLDGETQRLGEALGAGAGA